MSPVDARRRSMGRWGGAIALLLMVQSLIVAALFWTLATGSGRTRMDATMAHECGRFAASPPARWQAMVNAMLFDDVHRTRFLAVFDAKKRLIGGNVRDLPAGMASGERAEAAHISPNQLPGKTADTARLRLCPLPGGATLLTGFDLDDSEAIAGVIERSLMLALIPGLAIALGFGLLAARRAARQVDTVRRLAERIVTGDLRGRLPVSMKPDSFDLLCAHINVMLDRIEALMADIRFIADDIAHQIRTPLTRLRARIEREMETAMTPADFRRTALDALTDVDGTLRIVSALLRIRELEDHARRSRFAEIELADLVADAVDLHSPLAEDRGVRLVSASDASATVVGDADLLMEVLSNLIDNAVKFGPQPGLVTVFLESDGTTARIGVCDQGRGVPADEHSLVTQRFYRRTGTVEGCGLGLALVKAIAELHRFKLMFDQDGPAGSSRVYLLCSTSLEGHFPYP